MSDEVRNESEPDRLGLTIHQLTNLYELLDFQRPESAIVGTAQLLISELNDREIQHGIHRCMLETRRPIAKDILDRAKHDNPVPVDPLPGLPRLNAALAAAQGMFLPIPKNRTASKRYQSKGSTDWKEFSYNYADLGDILTAITPSLSANNLAISQPFVRLGGKLFLVTQLRHASGEILTSAGLQMPDEMVVSPQEFGSQHSYWRRYDLTGTVGVSAVEDDDGQFSHRGEKDTATGERNRASRSSVTKADVDKDKSSLRQGDPNRGHGNEQPAAANPDATPAPTPIVTEEKLTVRDSAGEEKPVVWKKIVARVKNVTGQITASNKQKSKYHQVIVEGLGTSNKAQEGVAYQPAMLFHCFRPNLFPILSLMAGKVCAFYFDPAEAKGIYYQNIEEVLLIDDAVYANGVAVETPKVEAKPEAKAENPDAEPPDGKSLFGDAPKSTGK